MERGYKDVGIVLRGINWGEADRLLTLYTSRRGRVRLVARGVRRLRSRKAGSLEVFSEVKIVVVQGRNLGIVTEVEMLNNHNGWRGDLVKVAVAYYLCELIDRLLPEEQSNGKVFSWLRESLVAIGRGNLRKLVRRFEEGLLDELGFGVPAVVRAKPGSLREYIETITERKIRSPGIVDGLFKKG